jgi:hypothetical protein
MLSPIPSLSPDYPHAYGIKRKLVSHVARMPPLADMNKDEAAGDVEEKSDGNDRRRTRSAMARQARAIAVF